MCSELLIGNFGLLTQLSNSWVQDYFDHSIPSKVKQKKIKNKCTRECSNFFTIAKITQQKNLFVKRNNDDECDI